MLSMPIGCSSSVLAVGWPKAWERGVEIAGIDAAASAGNPITSPTA
jgi:hypothetical protein